MTIGVTPSSGIVQTGSVHALAGLRDGDYSIPVTRSHDRSYWRADNTHVAASSTERASLLVRKRGGEILVAIASSLGPPDAPVVYGFTPKPADSGRGNVMWLPVGPDGHAEGAVYGRDGWRNSRSETYGSTYGVWLKLNGGKLEATFSYFGKTPRARSGHPWAPGFSGSVSVR